MADDLVERIARAMEPSGFKTFDRGYTNQNYIAERAFLNAERTAKIARRKARRVVEAITAAGLVVVPRNPSPEMYDAGGDELERQYRESEWEIPEDADVGTVWRAMITASEEH